MTRNHVLALAAGVGTFSAFLAVVANSIRLSDEWQIFEFRAEFGLADAAGVVSQVLAVLAFTFVAVGFRRPARPARGQALAVGAWLFAGYGVCAGVTASLRVVGSSGEPWKFTAGGVATVGASFVLAIAAVIAAVAFSARRDALLAVAAGVLAIAYALFAASSAFVLAGFLDDPYIPSPAKATWSFGLIAGGRFVEALAAVVAAVALSAGVARRAGLLGAGAIVFAAGLVIEGSGSLILVSGSARVSAWFDSASVLVAAAAATVAGVAFLVSRGRPEHGDGPYFAVPPDPA